MPRFTEISLAVMVGCGVIKASLCHAETLDGALAKAYRNNSDINAARALVRAVDEVVPITEAQYRPHVDVTDDLGSEHTDELDLTVPGTRRRRGMGNIASTTRLTQLSRAKLASDLDTIPREVGLNVSQRLFDGFRTTNRIRASESDIFSQRENLRRVEQDILQSATQAYMNVLRYIAVLDLRESDVKLIDFRLSEANDRLAVGDVTKVEVSEVEARLALARAAYAAAGSNLRNSIAAYIQVIGEKPTHLDPGRPLETGVPASLNQAITASQIEHPSVQAALHAVDKAELEVKVAEGAIYPQIAMRVSVDQSFAENKSPDRQVFDSSVIGRMDLPIYEGGAEYAEIRLSKERLAMEQSQAQVQRDNVRAAVVSAWGLLVSSKAMVEASEAHVKAAELALVGTREEERVGQRTLLEILNAQEVLLEARISLVDAERDRVVSIYAILSSVGRLSPSLLGLKVTVYDPIVHLEQVKDKWIGSRTPDGR